MNDNLPDILTPGNIAEQLMLSKNTVYSMLKQGIIKGFRVGNNKLWRIHRDDYIKYLDSAMYDN